MTTMRTTVKFRSWWLATGYLLIAAVVILSLIHIPRPLEMKGSDKLNHLLAYAVLMYWWGMLQPSHRTRWLLFLPLLGLALEGAQSAIPYRYFEWFDVVANLSGVLLGWLLLQTPARRLMSSINSYFSNAG